MIWFSISCIPPKSTHQASQRILKRKDGSQFIGKFATSKGKRAQDDLMSLLRPHTPPKPLEGALAVTIIWNYPWRKSEPKKNRVHGSLPCDTRPDCDNLAKGFLDIMGRLGYFFDDAQVAELNFSKNWSEHPGISVEIRKKGRVIPQNGDKDQLKNHPTGSTPTQSPTPSSHEEDVNKKDQLDERDNITNIPRGEDEQG